MTGKIVVFCAPSGAGKTTIARAVQKAIPSLHFSVSATTRSARPMEADGVDYFFLTRDQFMKRVSDQEFIEWEEVFGNLYGTLLSHVRDMIDQGMHVILDIDVKGGLNIKKQFQHRALTIFIEPPDLEVLIARLKARNTESEESLRRRLDRVPMEMELGKQFDVRVVNDQLETAIADCTRIISQFLEKE